MRPQPNRAGLGQPHLARARQQARHRRHLPVVRPSDHHRRAHPPRPIPANDAKALHRPPRLSRPHEDPHPSLHRAGRGRSPRRLPRARTRDEHIADWRRNDYSDGRHDFTTEQMHQAVFDAARSDMSRAIDSHYYESVRRHFPADFNAHVEACRALSARCHGKVGRMHLVDGDRRNQCDASPYRTRGRLATPTTPTSSSAGTTPRTTARRATTISLPVRCSAGHEAATVYASTIAAARKAIVVPSGSSELRVGDDRGRLGYWVKPKGALNCGASESGPWYLRRREAHELRHRSKGRDARLQPAWSNWPEHPEMPFYPPEWVVRVVPMLQRAPWRP